MFVTALKTSRAPRPFKPQHHRMTPTRLVPREKVEAMLHEIAYVLHVTRKVKREILDELPRA